MKIFPSKHERSIFNVIMAFCLGATVSLASQVDAKLLVGGLVTLFTAFIGAFYAFKLNQSREFRKEKLKNVDSANRAIFQAMIAFNLFAGFHRQFIEPSIGSPGAFFDIRPCLGITNWKLDIDYDSLSFLFGKNKGNILIELNQLEELARTTLESIQSRNHIHLNFIQPKMDEAGIVHGMNVSLADIDNIIGDRISKTMQGLTDQMIQFVNDGIAKSDRLVSKINSDMKEIYPDQVFIKMQKLNK